MLFAYTVWNLWKERNLQIFEKKITPDNILFYLILNQAKECAEIMELELSPEARNRQSQRPWLTWLSPFDAETIKINTDASKRQGDGMTTIAGVLRNHRGEWIRGFIGCTGVTSIYLAEMRAICEALLIAKDMNYGKIELESDSESVIHAIYGNNEVLSEEFPLVKDCRELLNLSTWNVRATYQPREKNRLADALTKLGYLVNEPVKLLDEPPEEVKKVYIDERISAARFLV